MSNKIQALFRDEAFLKEILPMSAEDAAAAFAREGVDVTAEELNHFAAQINAAAAKSSPNGELTEEALADVTGGASAATIAAAIGISIVVRIACTW